MPVTIGSSFGLRTGGSILVWDKVGDGFDYKQRIHDGQAGDTDRRRNGTIQFDGGARKTTYVMVNNDGTPSDSDIFWMLNTDARGNLASQTKLAVLALDTTHGMQSGATIRYIDENTGAVRYTWRDNDRYDDLDQQTDSRKVKFSRFVPAGYTTLVQIINPNGSQRVWRWTRDSMVEAVKPQGDETLWGLQLLQFGWAHIGGASANGLTAGELRAALEPDSRFSHAIDNLFMPPGERAARLRRYVEYWAQPSVWTRFAGPGGVLTKAELDGKVGQLNGMDRVVSFFQYTQQALAHLQAGNYRQGLARVEEVLDNGRWDDVLDARIDLNSRAGNELLGRLARHFPSVGAELQRRAALGGSYRGFVQAIKDAGVQARDDRFDRANTLLTELLGVTDSRHNPDFISSTLSQITRGAMDYATKAADAMQTMAKKIGEFSRLYDWLNATTTKADQNRLRNLDLRFDELSDKLRKFVESASVTMKNIRNDFKRIKSEQEAQQALAIVGTVFASFAMLGSIGFGIANWRALGVQASASGLTNTVGTKLSGLWNLPNGPALFGSGMLFLNNLITAVNYGSAADRLGESANVKGSDGVVRVVNFDANSTLANSLKDFKTTYGKFMVWLWRVSERPGLRERESISVRKTTETFPLDDEMVVRNGWVGYWDRVFKRDGPHWVFMGWSSRVLPV